jgi:PRTRC genetic system protein E
MTTQETLPFGYSEEELIEFKNNVDEKLIKANKELDFLKDLIQKTDPEKNKMEHDQLQQMITRQQTFINNLNEALIRIENKTYGICRVTGKLIDKPRLLAVPHATLSLEAKEKIIQKQFNDHIDEANAKEKLLESNKKSSKKSKPKKEKKQDTAAHYSDDDLRNFKTLISNKIDAANAELKYFNVVLADREKGIKIDGFEDMRPDEVKALIDRQQSFISELESALDRIKNKTYGICEETGELIPKEVLLQHLIIRRIKPTPEHPSPVIENKSSVRKCRICGCTDGDCSQCIEKTGQPCHWIAEDLCSACEQEAVDEPKAEIENQKSEGHPFIKELINQSNNDNDMNFFQQLAQAAAQNVDLTMRIMQKDGKLTLNIMPGAKSVTIKPILVTGTPQELDAEFFKTIAPGLSEINGIITNIEEVKNDLNKKKPESTNSKSENVKPGAKEATASAAKKKSSKAKSNNKPKEEIKPEVSNEAAPEAAAENEDVTTDTNEAAE